jgi:hypothetical protein
MLGPLRYALCGLAITLFAIQSAEACGDKLVALGGGMSYQRVFSSRHPGKLILFLRPDSALRAVNAELGIDTALVRAGHTVRTVTTRAELDQALQAAAADLVVTDWVDARELNVQVGGRVAILPVRVGERPHTSGFPNDSCLVDAGRRKGRQVVHAVEQVLILHSKGLPSGCSTSAAAS